MSIRTSPKRKSFSSKRKVNSGVIMLFFLTKARKIGTCPQVGTRNRNVLPKPLVVKKRIISRMRANWEREKLYRLMDQSYAQK